MSGGFLAGLFRYGESELEPAIQAEILFESARNEARVAIGELLLALVFAIGFMDFGRDAAFRPLAIFVLLTVLPLILDAAIRRSAAKKLLSDAESS